MKLLFLLALFFFFVGFLGIIIIQKNFLILLICLELMVLGCILNFLAAAKIYNNPKGQLFALLLLTISTAETAIGLSLFIKVFRGRQTLHTCNFTRFKY